MPFNTMRFRYSWRPYQQRVLEAINEHLNDQRLHVVAAPGAGKTTLGLEIFRILQKPTLILSPTRIIRDQWLSRLHDFCDIDDVSQLGWASNSIHHPEILTSITYQALHAKFFEELNYENKEAGNDELNYFIKIIQENNIQILILDEAHHLRSEWWRALEKVCESFPRMILVSLTATPPYDSQGQEWARYEKLCGPIDEEISVPELVKAGTLCAHQDFLWACNATLNEKKQIQEYDNRVSTLCQNLFDNKDFEALVLSHPWLHRDDIEQEVIQEPEIAIAVLSYMKARILQDGTSSEKSAPVHQKLMTLLDLGNEDIPDLGRHWWQVLLESLLFSKTFQHSDTSKPFIDLLRKQLKASELLHKRELSLERSRRMERSLSLSPSKIDACATIHRLEYRHRGDSLRQVVLTDFIRDESLISGLDTGEINLGAWPVFQRIVASSAIADQVCLLTGRLCIISGNRLAHLLRHIDSDRITTEAMENNPQYLRVTGPLNILTSAFTAMLMSGDLKVLVGTRSLLGEGWDAPAVNSLILASSVGSFMLTNQMRGRAIRIDPQQENKISSIWHLFAVNARSYTGWSDYYFLTSRFETFVGLSEKELTIESGFERMKARDIASNNLLGQLNETAPITANNRQMLRRYRQRHTIAERWHKALTLDETARIIPSVKTNKVPDIRGIMLKYSLSYLLMQFTLMLSALWMLIRVPPKSGSQLLLMLLLVSGAILLYKLPKTISVLKIVFYYLPVDGALKKIGQALAEALCQAGFIETSIRQMKVSVIKLPDGAFYLSLSGSSFYESSLFADCLAEILAPIENPRYLVLREGVFLGSSREDYHAVPMKFAAKKETATIFYKSWCKNVSLSELIYTRSPEGRKRLLKARMKAFSATFSAEIKRQDRWQ